MRDNNAGRLLPAGRVLLMAGAAALILSGCAVHGAPYGSGPYHSEKVAVCHKNKKTLMLPESAVDAHLGHGDTLGRC